MVTFITVIYVFVCIFLILVVLLQAGKGGGMGAAFGGSTQTVFGGAGAGNFLTRLTVFSAALFMFLSATLAYLSSSGEQSLDRASERVRMRQEALKGGATSDDEGAATAATDAGLSTDDGLGTETPEQVTADAGTAAVPEDEKTALEAVDEALANQPAEGEATPNTNVDGDKPVDSEAPPAD